MQIGVSQLIARDMPLADFLQQAAQAGYEVVELCMRREGELTPESQPDQLARIVAAAEAHGLALASMAHSHCTGNLLDSGPVQQTSIASFQDTAVAIRKIIQLG
jgi:sugar phosphate isomerase/epimerase